MTIIAPRPAMHDDGSATVQLWVIRAGTVESCWDMDLERAERFAADLEAAVAFCRAAEPDRHLNAAPDCPKGQG